MRVSVSIGGAGVSLGAEIGGIFLDTDECPGPAGSVHEKGRPLIVLERVGLFVGLAAKLEDMALTMVSSAASPSILLFSAAVSASMPGLARDCVAISAPDRWPATVAARLHS